MNRKEVINSAYEYLRFKGIVHTQKDVAQKMGASVSNVSSALNGVESVLTERFLRRFNIAFGNLFNDEWLMTGEGEMLKPIVQTVVEINDNKMSGASQIGLLNKMFGPGARENDNCTGNVDTLQKEVEMLNRIVEEKERAIEDRDKQIEFLKELLKNKKD